MTENTVNENEFSLLRLMPTVLRARDFRLYTQGGKRIVDLWQNGGAAILGHTPPAILRELKNTASRGLYAPLPHFTEGRYIKALSRIFPGRNFRLYAAPPPELANGARTKGATAISAHALVANKIAALWRPFLAPADPLAVPKNAPPVLIPVVPGIQGWRDGLPLGLCVLAIAPAFEKTLPPGDYLSQGDYLSPTLLAIAARGIYDLIAAAPERAKPAYPRIARALKNNQQKAFRWKREGIYLTPEQTPSPQEWAALFSRFLDGGFLLPPVPSQPVILPGALSPGEEAKLAELLLALT